MQKTKHNFLPVGCKVLIIVILLSFIWGSSACSSLLEIPPTPYPTSVPHIPSSDALITFRLTLPEPIPAGDSIYISILDEVTGLGLNIQKHIMEAEDETHYFVILPFVMGSIVKYRYHREGGLLAQEHQPDGRPVRYRLYLVEGPGITNDVLSRWTDTKFQSRGGQLHGRIIDSSTGQPLPSILIAVGGTQVFSHADGSFYVNVLSPGVHNLVAYAIDGGFLPYQQGASIQTDTSTFAQIFLKPTENVTITFLVDLPDNTPPEIPVHFAGNLYQLGNSFTDLTGGVNSLVTRMPTLDMLSDGRYHLEIHLPSGIDLRYKYTLGDGYWNSELTQIGETRLRQIIVPNHDLQIQDNVDSWDFGSKGAVNFQVSDPNSHANEIMYIQLDPGFGWMEPIPMRGSVNPESGSIIWNYTILNPLNTLTALNYRFCLEGECNRNVPLNSDGTTLDRKAVTITQSPQFVEETLSGWSLLTISSQPAIAPNVVVEPRGNEFTAGIALQSTYSPSYESKIPFAISNIKSLNANMIVFQPSWEYTSYQPPTLEFSPDTSPNWYVLKNWIEQSHKLNLSTTLFPIIDHNFDQLGSQPDSDNYPLDWNVWFDNYSRMVYHFAALANQSSVDALVIGRDWITPPTFPPSSLLPSDITNSQWRNLITNIREHYSGDIIWFINYSGKELSTPPFLDQVDKIYILWSDTFTNTLGTSYQRLHGEFIGLIDSDLYPLWDQFNKPIILAVSFTSMDLTAQMTAYNAIMLAVNERPWINGIISMDYYPILPIHDISASVNGKPASGILWYWFQQFLRD